MEVERAEKKNGFVKNQFVFTQIFGVFQRTAANTTQLIRKKKFVRLKNVLHIFDLDMRLIEQHSDHRDTSKKFHG